VAKEGYSETVQIPRASRAVVEEAIAAAVRSGRLWLLSGPASILGEEIPTGVLDDAATLRKRPLAVPATEILSETLPDAWEGTSATALSIATALHQKQGVNLPWTVVREAIDAGRWAILVAVQNYEDASLAKLAYPDDDAKLLRESLVQRYRVPVDQAVLIADPSQVRLQQGLPEVLGRVKAEDEVLVYYAGHACRDKDGTVYLAPANFNHEQMAASGVTLRWLVDQLEKCPAKQKLLLLDAIGDAEEGGSAAEMLQSLSARAGRNPLRSLVAITNCSEGQQGNDWPAKQHGLFAFTLAEGYSGTTPPIATGGSRFRSCLPCSPSPWPPRPPRSSMRRRPSSSFPTPSRRGSRRRPSWPSASWPDSSPRIAWTWPRPTPLIPRQESWPGTSWSPSSSRDSCT
jgi:hypothetical protein